MVNKEWCNVVVPILWKKLFSWYQDYRDGKKVKESKKKLFNTILSCLPSPSKRILSNNNIKLPHSNPPLFNYVSFCEFPSTEIVGGIINMIFEEFSAEDSHRNLLEQEIYKLFVSQCNNIKKLQWETSQPLPLFPGASTCFSQLNRLFVDIDLVDSNALYEMAQICKGLNYLTIYDCYQDLPGLISLIDAQKNLTSVTIYHTYS